MNTLDRNHGQVGSAIVMALFLIVLLTGMGVSLLFLSQQESRMGQANLRVKKAFYLAEAGLENGRMTLFALNGGGDFDDELTTVAGADGIIDFDPANVRPTYDQDGAVTGFTGYGDDVPLRAMTGLGTASDKGWYIAFLTNDPIQGRGVLDDTNDRVMLTGIGAGANRSMEVVEAIIEPLLLLPEVPPAAITLLGEAPIFANGNSNPQRHDGNDCGVSGGAYAPLIGTISQSAAEQVRSDAQRLDEDHFTSGPFGGEETIGDLTNPADPIVEAAGHGTIDSVWTDCLALKQMVLDLSSRADYYCNTDTDACEIPDPVPPLVVIDGDLTQTPAGDYTGVLVVTGRLTYNGTTGWDGVILSIGEGYIRRTGGGGGNPSGAVIIASIDPTPDGARADKSDWCDNGFESAEYDVSGGGNSTVQWCTDRINIANPVETYQVLEFVQR